MEFDFKEKEPYWQKKWEDEKLYEVIHDSSKPKYYVLDMFPYPSGAGLHVGHPLGYITSDIYSRYKRLKGFNVLHPMGFDAFGLPAEQYAIQSGKHPAITTQENIDNFKQQLRKIGLSYDWSREVKTCDPGYYKWTQWIFLQLYDSWYDTTAGKAKDLISLVRYFVDNGNEGLTAATTYQGSFTAAEWKAMEEYQKKKILMEYRLAYQSYSEVWYCPELGTVLANDEVKDGLSERGGHPVHKQKLRQWFLRITAFAERLLSGLERVDFPESLKEMQRHWIGRSTGASMHFSILGTDKSFEIYTTRPDTIFGVTFMVLAPEHPMVKVITTSQYQEDIDAYLAYVIRRSERDRLSEVKTVTGAFTGSYAIHPFTRKPLPIWISEYVLASYGTGAIMAVPADDDRDEAFAQKFNLPIIEILDKSMYLGAGRGDKLGKLIHSSFLDGMEVWEAIDLINTKIEEMGIGHAKINYKLRDAGFSRQRYWGEPFPIYYMEDTEDAIPLALPPESLPITLPEVSSYQPAKGGTKSPLSDLRDWVEYAPGHYRETDTMPGYAGSSWYFLRYMDPNQTESFAGKEALDYWRDVDFYIGGAEHAVGHLLYSRMWHKFLFDRGWVGTDEPFKKIVNQGMIQGRSNIAFRIKDTNTYISAGLKDAYDTTEIKVDVSFVDRDDFLDIKQFIDWRAEYANADFILENGKYRCGVEVEKMSKSKFNTVNPDRVINEYGADCFRMFEMFLGPIEASKPWDTKGIEGVSKFLKKYWRLHIRNESFEVSEEEPTSEEWKILFKTVKKINDDMDRLAFNTSVSSFMVCINELSDLKCNKREIVEKLAIILSPYAPYITEEIWYRLGHTNSVHTADFPEVEEIWLVENEKEYPISINGKVRSKIRLPKDISANDAEILAMNDPLVTKWLGGKSVKKFVFVPGKIINIAI